MSADKLTALVVAIAATIVYGVVGGFFAWMLAHAGFPQAGFAVGVLVVCFVALEHSLGFFR